jgi:hypothetical protein
VARFSSNRGLFHSTHLVFSLFISFAAKSQIWLSGAWSCTSLNLGLVWQRYRLKLFDIRKSTDDKVPQLLACCISDVTHWHIAELPSCACYLTLWPIFCLSYQVRLHHWYYWQPLRCREMSWFFFKNGLLIEENGKTNYCLKYKMIIQYQLRSQRCCLTCSYFHLFPWTKLKWRSRRI